MVSSIFTNIFSWNSYQIQNFSEYSCKKRAKASEPATTLHVSLYGNASASAKALYTILQTYLASSNNIFNYAGLTVISTSLLNTTILQGENVVVLSVPPDQENDQTNSAEVLTGAQIGGIVGGGVGFIIIIVVVVFIVFARKRKTSVTPKRKHATTMNIPRYPVIPIDTTLNKNKKKKKERRSTFFDIFGHGGSSSKGPAKSASKSSIMRNMAGDV